MGAGSGKIEPQSIKFEGVPARVFRAEHIVAIAASVGRKKNLARIEQMLQRPTSTKHCWKKSCNGIN
ncbi:MAG: hypothetical protein WBN75_05475 [Verrucomicrobiia bacterium]|jgi:hypothetical protein